MRTTTAFIAVALLSSSRLADELAPARPDRPWRGDTYTLPSNGAVPLPPPPPNLVAGHAYSLAELIDIAQSANPATRVAWDQARIAAQTAGIAEALFLPNL